MKLVNRLFFVLLLLSAVILAGCDNPTGSNAPARTIDDGNAPDGGDSQGVSLDPITISFVLDTDTGEGLSLSTTAMTPAPIQATAGVPVRLNQGAGFTATFTMPDGSLKTFYASGWSTDAYSTQFVRITDPTGPAPTGTGYYLPGFEAVFDEDTTLYIRWLPGYDNVAARITYQEPGGGSNAATTAVLHLRDEIPFESMAHFDARIAPSWTVPQDERIFTWTAADSAHVFSRSATDTSGKPAVWQFAEASPNFLFSEGSPGLREITMTYTSREVYSVTFNYNGAPAGPGGLTREAFRDVALAEHTGWWDITDPVWNTFTLEGWYTDPGFSTASNWDTAMASGDLTLYARWQVQVAFNGGGGTGGGTAWYDVDANGTVSPPTLTTSNDQWDEFVGWFTDPNFTGQVSPASGRLPVTEHTTFYAGWGPKYSIGDVGPGEGRIFYIVGGTAPRWTVSNPQGGAAGTQWRFLEVAPGNTPQASAGWGLNYTTPEPAPNRRFTTEEQDDIGMGGAATHRIVNEISDSFLDSDSAAYLAVAYESGSQTDWYLPAAQELLEIAVSGVWQSAGMGTFTYWSSASYENSTKPDYPDSSDMTGRAFAVSLDAFGAPVVAADSRSMSRRVRPVRRF